LHYDQENIVHLVVEILGSELPAHEETDAAGEETVEILHAGRFAALDPIHQVLPVGLRGAGRPATLPGRIGRGFGSTL
jgi:hypothetical protein